MRDLSEINMNQGGKPVTRRSPLEAEIQAFEKEFNVSLPADYVAFLNYSNGGHPELDSVLPEARSDLPPRGLDHFYYLDNDWLGSSSLWSGAAAWRELLGQRYVAFAEDAGGNPFLFDLSQTPLAIITCLHDEGLTLLKMASSFGAFIDALEADPDMI